MNKLKFFVPYDFINWNEYIRLERSNKYGANELKQKEKHIVKMLVRRRWEGGYPVQITFKPHFSSYRKDLDNTRVKGLVDGLVVCGVLKNDNLKHIQRIVYEPVFDKRKGIEVEIEEL